MFYVYLIQNSSERWYIGSTGDLKRRFAQHISGKNLSTKYDKSWKLLYHEAYTNEKLARTREKSLKKFGSTLGHLMKRLGIKGRG